MVDKAKGKIRVFVYGTLKRGNGLHALIERGNTDFIGRNYIESNLMLADMGFYPALVPDTYEPSAKYKVFGEVYAVDDETLAAIDMAEGHPRLYKRHKVWTSDPAMKVWAYVLQDKPGEYAEDWIEDGVWNGTDAEIEYAKAHR